MPTPNMLYHSRLFDIQIDWRMNNILYLFMEELANKKEFINEGLEKQE